MIKRREKRQKEKRERKKETTNDRITGWWNEDLKPCTKQQEITKTGLSHRR